MKLPDGMTAEQLTNLTARHIVRYSGLIEASDYGRPGIRRGECKQLLDIWEGIKERKGSLDSSLYTAAQLSEIRDAWFDECCNGSVDYNI